MSTDTTTPLDTTTTEPATVVPAVTTVTPADAGATAPGDGHRRRGGGLVSRIRRRRRRRRPTVPPLGPYRLASPGSFDLAAMGARIAEAGPAASPALLAEVASRARAQGMRSNAVGLLTDHAAPDVVRTRAFAVVSSDLAATAPPPRREVAA